MAIIDFERKSLLPGPGDKGFLKDLEQFIRFDTFCKILIYDFCIFEASVLMESTGSSQLRINNSKL